MKVLAVFPAYNEEGKIGRAVSKVPRNVVDEVLVIDDCSSDKTRDDAQNYGAKVLNNDVRSGVGYCIRRAITYGLKNNFDVIVILAGNDKDNPQEIPRLLDKIIKENYDFVQGSRYLKGGCWGNMPLYRIIATKFIHPFVFSLLVGKYTTDTTNGFRAFRLTIFKDKRINIWQDWLNKYELEPYLYFKVIKCGYKVCEVPVSKIYPTKGTTKMRIFTDWWNILKPIFYLWLGFKK